MVTRIGDALGDLSWLTKEPDEPKPEPLRCEGRNDDGQQCPTRLNPFPMFGRWNRPTICERCRDKKFEEKQKVSIVQQGVQLANLPHDYEPRVELPEDLKYFLGTCGQEFVFVHGQGGVRNYIEAVVYRYVTDRTSRISKAAALYEMEHIMVDRLRPDGGRKLDDYIAPKLLAIDGFGNMRPSEWVSRQVYAILDERRRLRRKTIIGSEWSLKELSDGPWPPDPRNNVGYDPAIIRTIYEWAGGDQGRISGQLNVVKIR